MKNSTIVLIGAVICFILCIFTKYQGNYDRGYFFLEMFFLANYYLIKTIEEK